MSGSAGPSTPSVSHVPLPVPPTYTPPDSYDSFRGTHAPLIIDNGASTLRFGFSTSAALTPHCVQNVVARFKERKYNQPLLLFGDGVDAESGSKGQAKTPWEGDVLLNFDALVRYALSKPQVLQSRLVSFKDICIVAEPRRAR
jgi:actin-related protein 5